MRAAAASRMPFPVMQHECLEEPSPKGHEMDMRNSAFADDYGRKGLELLMEGLSAEVRLGFQKQERILTALMRQAQQLQNAPGSESSGRGCPRQVSGESTVDGSGFMVSVQAGAEKNHLEIADDDQEMPDFTGSCMDRQISPSSCCSSAPEGLSGKFQHYMEDDNQIGGDESDMVGELTMGPRRKKRLSQWNKELRQKADDRAIFATAVRSTSSVASSLDRPRLQSARDRVKALMERQEVGTLTFFIIATNVVIVGVEVDVSSRLPLDQVPEVFAILNAVYTFFFTLEFLLKIFGYGPYVYVFGPDRIWNGLDFVIVVFALAEVLIEESMKLGHMRVFRIFRVARIVRSVRAVRILKFVASLRSILLSIIHTLRTLFWTLVLVCLNVYGVGVALTQGMSDHCREETAFDDMTPHCSDADLVEFWGDLSTSMLTLLKTVTNGVSWHDSVKPLHSVGVIWVFIYVCYVIFMMFAVLNVVTGVFCQSAIESAAADKEMATLAQLQNRRLYMDSIKKLFQEIDEDGSNEITIDELEQKLEEEAMKAFFDSINVDTQDAWLLFSLIDKDVSGSIDLEEFVTGCLSLKGSAKAIHIAKLSLENKGMKNTIDSFEESFERFKSDIFGMLSQGPGSYRLV
eukprot:TRINITY_DN26839_c0_g1_i1.p1 TRINITY_DN26839_c0_g1~~TRINITY_DN26839_c0_g1_i1.p1  ORF type:complete len:632 (+),score=107.81 TRINITY_DN26839_c0_g1_i1:54-1949(+)